NVYNHRLTAVGGSDPFAKVNQYLSSSDSIAPGQSKTFSFVMTAPSSAGTYTTDWRMTQSSGGLFGETLTAKVIVESSGTTTSNSTTNSTTTISTTSTSTLTAVSANDAQIISDSIPEAMIAGKTYTVSVTVKNTGSTTWKNVYNYR